MAPTKSEYYDDIRREAEAARAATNYKNGNGNGNGGFRSAPSWIQMLLAVGAVLVAITMAYSSLHEQQALTNMKLDLFIQRVDGRLSTLEAKEAK